MNYQLSQHSKPSNNLNFQQFMNYVFCFSGDGQEGVLPLRIMCQRVGISIQTALDWRHRLMNSLCIADTKFIHDTQIDDIWVNYSQKGRKGLKYSKERGGCKKSGDNDFQVKVLTATDKTQTVMNVARIGRITKADIERNLANKLGVNSKIISDSHASIIAFAKDNNLRHTYFKAKEHVSKIGDNVQFLNSQASRLKTMLNGTCKGVSTKYLQNYANWFSFMETNKGKDINGQATIAILENMKGWNNWTNAESTYKKFIEDYSVRTYRCPVARTWKANNWNIQKFPNM